jgi:chromosome segregation ATPase
MLSSGINEREAMRKRLAAANAWATSANKRMDLAREMDKLSQQSLENEIRIVDNAKQMLATAMANHETAKMNRETAKKNIESATEDIENSQDEKKAAEAQLKEAEERSRVIDVDVLSPAAASPKPEVNGTYYKKGGISDYWKSGQWSPLAVKK